MTARVRQIGIRLSAEDVKRLDRLTVAMATSTGLEVTRTDVHRAALAKGLELLEEEHGSERRKR